MGSTTEAEYLTLAEVALKLRMTEDYVRRQCHAGTLKATKLGNRWRIDPASVEAFMSGAVKPARSRDPKLSARQQKRAS